MGVHIGDALVGPKEGNPRGHFESTLVLDFHQKRLTERLGTYRRAFDDGMLIQQPVDPVFSPEEEAAAREVVAGLSREGPWGWKEPRTCLFLSLWLKMLPGAAGLVVYRHPLEVQQSLLRRQHWDLALFPDQAMRAYSIYNSDLLDWQGGPRMVFNANAGFTQLDALAGEIAGTFGLAVPESLPAFHADEFHMLLISESLHRLTTLLHPGAAATFDRLQEAASMPMAFTTRDDDARIDKAFDHLEPLLADVPPEGRAWFGPFLDWIASGREAVTWELFGRLAESIGERVRRVEEWNRQAAGIYKENERLSVEYERMGTEFAKQQDFLAKQVSTLETMFNELKRTGDSWTEQRDMIKGLIAEKKQLEARICELEGREPPADA
jgi:hypothetical protein